jgi:AbrB family looped-hinge helix DNA binding protein
MSEKATALTGKIDKNIVLRVSYRSGKALETVKLSSKYQVVIPKSVRRAMNLKAGQKLQIIPLGDRIELVLESRLSDLRGFLRGIDTGFEREDERS